MPKKKWRLNLILTLKKYRANKYTILSLKRIMRIYSNVYNYVICPQIIMRLYSNAYNYAVYLQIIMKSIMRINVQPGISLFAHFKHKAKIYDLNFPNLLKIKNEHF